MPAKRRKGSRKGTTKKVKEATADCSNPPASLTTPYSEARCKQWFKRLAVLDAEDSSVIGINGTIDLCEELDVAAENVVILAIAWKMQCRTMGTFTEEEWLRGMRALECDSGAKLKAKLPLLRQQIQDAKAAKELFAYAYNFVKSCNENPAQRTIDMDSAISMMNILLRGKWPDLGRFTGYLRDHAACKVVNRDQWVSLYEFQNTISADFSNFDEMDAWPTLLDEYVEWARAAEDQGGSAMSVGQG